MSDTTYNTLFMLLATGAYIALAVVVVSLIGMIVCWKSNYRRGHVIRLILAVVVIPCFIGIGFAINIFIVLPAQAEKQRAEYNALHDAQHDKTTFVRIGDSVPDFSLITADGEKFSMSKAKGQVVLINFFATWCGPCKIELPHIDEIWADYYSQDDFKLVVIGREETMNSVKEFKKKNKFSFPIAPDPDRSIYSLFAKEYIPRTFVISKEGVVVFSKSGFTKEDLGELRSILKVQLGK